MESIIRISQFLQHVINIFIKSIIIFVSIEFDEITSWFLSNTTGLELIKSGNIGVINNAVKFVAVTLTVSEKQI